MNRATGNVIFAVGERTICSITFSQLRAHRDGGHMRSLPRRMIFLL
jgi:hypothetical protein